MLLLLLLLSCRRSWTENLASEGVKEGLVVVLLLVHNGRELLLRVVVLPALFGSPNKIDHICIVVGVL